MLRDYIFTMYSLTWEYIDPRKGRRNLGRLALMGGMVAVHWARYQINMHLSTYGDGLNPLIQEFDVKLAYGRNTTWAAEHNITDNWTYTTQIAEEYYGPIAWQVGELVFANVITPFIMTNIIVILEKCWALTIRHDARTEMFDTMFDDKTYLHLDTSPEKTEEETSKKVTVLSHTLVYDLGFYYSTLLSLTNLLISSAIATGTGVTKLWQAAGAGLSFSLLGHALRIPLHTVWIAGALAGVQGAWQLLYTGRVVQKRFEEMNAIANNMILAINYFFAHRSQIGLLNGEKKEKERLLVEQDRATQSNRKHIYTKAISELGNTVIDVLSKTVGVMVGVYAVMRGDLPMSQFAAFQRHWQDSGAIVKSYSQALEWVIDVTQSGQRVMNLKHQNATLKDLFIKKGLKVEQGGDRLVYKDVRIPLPDDKPLLQKFNLTLPKGLGVVMAPSGSGKSTLAQAASDMLLRGEGTIRIPKGKRLHVAPQEVFIPYRCSLLTAILYARPNASVTKKDREKVEDYMTRLGLSHKIPELDVVQEWDKEGLSGGERKRLALIQTCMSGADIYILDELYAGVDKDNQVPMLEIIQEEAGKGKDVLMIEHVQHQEDPLLQAASYVVKIENKQVKLQKRTPTQSMQEKAPPHPIHPKQTSSHVDKLRHRQKSNGMDGEPARS